MNSNIIKNIRKKVTAAKVGVRVVVPFFIDSGNYALNYILSGSLLGGWPAGRVIELFGDPATGKSLLVGHAIANTQKVDGVAILDDVENAYSADFGETLGIDTDELIMLNSMMLEDYQVENPETKKKEKIRGHLNTVVELFQLIRKEDAECPIFVGLDSIAQLTTKHEQEVSLDAVDMSKAKIVRAFMRLIGGPIAQHKVCYIVTNHSTSTLNMYGPATTTPGGSGVKYSATHRVELKLKDKIKTNKGKVIGVITRARCVKNRVTAPFKECEMEIYFDGGVDRFSGLFELLQVEEIIEQSSPGWYTIPSIEDGAEPTKMRRDDLITKYLKDAECIKKINDSLVSKPMKALGTAPIESTEESVE